MFHSEMARMRHRAMSHTSWSNALSWLEELAFANTLAHIPDYYADHRVLLTFAPSVGFGKRHPATERCKKLWCNTNPLEGCDALMLRYPLGSYEILVRW